MYKFEKFPLAYLYIPSKNNILNGSLEIASHRSKHSEDKLIKIFGTDPNSI